MNEQQQVAAPNKLSKRTKLALRLLIIPTVLIVVSFTLFAIVNWVFAAPTEVDGELFAPSSPAVTIANVLIYFIGLGAVLAWLPGIIIGIVLLATRK